MKNQTCLIRLGILACLLACVMIGVNKSEAATDPHHTVYSVGKLSKTALTFKSKSAKSKSVTAKINDTVLKKKVNSYTVQGDVIEVFKGKPLAKIKIKGNKITVTPKYAGTETVRIIALDKNKQNVCMVGELKIKIKGKKIAPISKKSDLDNIRNNSYSFYLKKDLDLTGGRQNESGILIPYELGSLDGKGHTIKCNTPVFNITKSIKNVNFEVDFKIKDGKYQGVDNAKIYRDRATAPISFNEGTVANCTAKGNMAIEFSNEPCDWSGLVGWNAGAVSRCKSNVNITLTGTASDSWPDSVGGVVGKNYTSQGTAAISECLYSGQIDIQSYNIPKTIGGFDRGIVQNIGGICGYSEGKGIIINCLNTGTVEYNPPSENIFDDPDYVYHCGAGILGCGGKGTTIENVLSLGKADCGILCKPETYNEEGEYEPNWPEFKNAFWLISKTKGKDTGGSSSMAGATGLNDDRIADKAVFTGFDFSKVWKMGTKGPTLKNV